MLKRPQILYPIIYGALAGFGCFLFLIILYNVLNINPLGGKKETAIIFIIVAMIAAVAQTRKANGGAIEFGKGYTVCFSTSIISAIVSVIGLYFFLTILSKNSLPEYIQFTTNDLVKNKAQIIKNGISEADYTEALKNIKITSVKSILLDDFIKKIFLGIIPSLMISLYYRRRFLPSK